MFRKILIFMWGSVLLHYICPTLNICISIVLLAYAYAYYRTFVLKNELQIEIRIIN